MQTFALGVAVLSLAFVIDAHAAEANTSNRVITTNALADRALTETVILHVGRDRTSYDKGHIPSARFLALSDIVVTRDGVPNEMPTPEELARVFGSLGVKNNGSAVLYGDMQGLFAARAWTALDYIGVRASLLDGGFERWRAEDRAIETAPGAPNNSGSLQPSQNLNVLVDYHTAKDLLGRKNIVFVDARPPEEYSGAKTGDGVTRAGHIPGAVNIFWKLHLVSDADPVLKADGELRAMFEKAGVTRDKKVVAYCRTGVQASHTYFVLRRLGYDIVLYDGSFIEWSAQPDAPVEQ